MITLHGLGSIVEDLSDKLIPMAVTDVRLRTTLSEEAPLITADAMLDLVHGRERPPMAPGVGKKLLYALKPTFIVNSPTLGQKVYAPYGKAMPGDAKKSLNKILAAGALVALGFVGLGFAIGRIRG